MPKTQEISNSYQKYDSQQRFTLVSDFLILLFSVNFNKQNILANNKQIDAKGKYKIITTKKSKIEGI